MRLTLLACLLLSGCADKHPVMPFPKHWQMPSDYAHCQPGDEQIRWPDGRVTVVVACPSGSVYLDKRTGQLVDVDTLDFRVKK